MLSGLTPEHHAAAEAVAALLRKSIKTVAMRVVDYEAALSRFVADVINGKSDAVDMARAHRALIRTSAPEVYAEGMAEAGDYKSPEDARAAFTEDDEKTIDTWVSGQLEYVRGFAKDCADALAQFKAAMRAATSADEQEKALAAFESAQAGLNQRVVTWASALEELAGQARAAQMGNPMCHWEYGDTEHCVTCLWLNDQHHRLNWFTERNYIPRQNGSETLDCGGWRCQCQIVNDKTGERVM